MNAFVFLTSNPYTTEEQLMTLCIAHKIFSNNTILNSSELFKTTKSKRTYPLLSSYISNKFKTKNRFQKELSQNGTLYVNMTKFTSSTLILQLLKHKLANFTQLSFKTPLKKNNALNEFSMTPLWASVNSQQLALPLLLNRISLKPAHDSTKSSTPRSTNSINIIYKQNT